MMDCEEKYEQLSKEFDEFVYIVSHDLRAPLRQISSFLSLLLDDLNVELNEEQAMFKSMMDECVQDADDILLVLLEYSRIKTSEDRFETFQVADVLSHCRKELSEDIKTSETQIHSGDLSLPLFADRELINRAFSCILDNAIKFRKSGTAPIIDISATTDSEFTTITIQDNGIGIDEDKIEHALTILRQLNPKSAYQGNGAGLAYAKKIAELHQGALDIEPAPSGGICVHLKLKTARA